jgi:MFS transporter, AAHS family, 4-hydroxybenzoate transporter
MAEAMGSAAPRVYLRVAWLCGLALCLEGYDIAAVGYAIPPLVDAWGERPAAFTLALAAGNVGLLLGSLSGGLLGDRLPRKSVLIACVVVFGVFSLISALAASPQQLAVLRFVTGLGLGGGVPLAIAVASELASSMAPGRRMILVSTGVPIGFAIGGLLASRLVPLFGWQAIFVVGGALPLALAPVLRFGLPKTVAQGANAHSRDLVASLFQKDLAPGTALLWAINLLNLLAVYFVVLWMPAILHSVGASPSQAIFTTTMYSIGVVAAALLTAPVVERFGMEPVLTCGLAGGAICVVSIGLFDPPFWLLLPLVCGAGASGGSQAGINALSSLAYPLAIRSTGAGWALGAGRAGAIAGPLAGGALLALGFGARGMFVAAAIPIFVAAALMAALGRVRHIA